MENWKITQAIENGIENGLEKIGNKISDFFTNMLVNTGNVLLDGIATFIIIMILYTAFKFMITINKDKQAENINMLISLGGLYFIVRMLARILVLKG